jgi:DMSO reductase anchor subunit
MEIQWSLVFYSLFLGLAIGPFAVAALTDCLKTHPGVCKWGAVVALVSLVLAGISAFTHLGTPLHAINVFNNLLGSDLSREVLVTFVTGVIALVFWAQMFLGILPNYKRGVAWAGLVFSALSAFLIGVSYMVNARPMWNSWLLPLTLLTSSIPMGLLAMLVVSNFALGADVKDRLPVRQKLVQWTFIVLVVYAVIAALYLFVGGAQAGVLNRIVAGDLAVGFWLGVVVVGLALPLALVFMSQRADDKRLTQWVTIAFVLVLAGGIVIRALLFVVGVRVPLLPM